MDFKQVDFNPLTMTRATASDIARMWNLLWSNGMESKVIQYSGYTHYSDIAAFSRPAMLTNDLPGYDLCAGASINVTDETILGQRLCLYYSPTIREYVVALVKDDCYRIL